MSVSIRKKKRAASAEVGPALVRPSQFRAAGAPPSREWRRPPRPASPTPWAGKNVCQRANLARRVRGTHQTRQRMKGRAAPRGSSSPTAAGHDEILSPPARGRVVATGGRRRRRLQHPFATSETVVDHRSARSRGARCALHLNHQRRHTNHHRPRPHQPGKRGRRGGGPTRRNSARRCPPPPHAGEEPG